ncbi:radical SAM protein [Desulfobulbus elongatus]|uniref:radical SAM protein n=1 Tax=Desulfobulbus elongatus TaxID=53332 RepID=UPI000488BB4A|nr:radical SAM protein [Desulfobulbus elongatus]
MSWPWPFSVSPRLDWLQVEISTRCTAACRYCPRTLYASRWQDRLLPKALFARLMPVFKKTALVHLQGWGEPLLHPDFMTMVRMVKAAGCRVGTTTNGMLLTEDLCRRMIEAEMDVLAFSLAGIDAANDRIRLGTSLDRVLAAIATLDRLKRQCGSERPAIHIAYLLLRSRLDDCALLPRFFASLGVEQVVVSTLDLVAGRECVAEALVPADEAEYAALRRRLDAMVAAGRDLGLPIHVWLAAPQGAHGTTDDSEPWPPPNPAGSGCTEHIERAAVVAADGGVSPCVYTHLPVCADVCHWIDGRETAHVPLVFGNIGRQSFAAIWRSREYRTFRKAHAGGQPPRPCRTCVRLRMR